MTKAGSHHYPTPPGTARIATAVLLAALLVFPAISLAAAPASPEQAEPVETIAVPRDAIELGIYKQGFEVSANVQCRVPKKGPSYCYVDIGSEIQYQIEPEMILKYTSIRLDEQEFATEITPQGSLKFRTNKVNYSGPQTFEVEVIYLK